MQIGQRYYGVASGLALLLAVPSASVNADGTTDVYSRNDDGTFSPTATYLVDHDEAIAAYELSPAFRDEGGGLGGARRTRPNSVGVLSPGRWSQLPAGKVEANLVVADLRQVVQRASTSAGVVSTSPLCLKVPWWPMFT